MKKNVVAAVVVAGTAGAAIVAAKKRCKRDSNISKSEEYDQRYGRERKGLKNYTVVTR